MDVWYVSYGSNLCENRFLCYINGDRPPGSTEHERGCMDKSPPKASELVELPYPLYFAKERSKWGKGGVAFIGHDKTNNEITIGRKYLISAEQFAEVVAQENNLPAIEIDLDHVLNNRFEDISMGWYGRIMYLGEAQGFPMFTFTSNASIGKVEFTKPSAAYLSTIANGLAELGLTEEAIINYFINKKGICGNFTKESLRQYIFKE